ncbi:MAG: rRNA maturation RNase YbeY [Burkholderiaceae bacterium]|nr:rRNA maturation RNase YbeY [Burkholderiaceae bacterium]
MAAEPAERPKLSLSIQLGDEVNALPASRAQLRRWVAAAIESDAQIVLRFVGEREGRALNSAYRGRDYATNVLTFAYDEPDAVHADIVVCLPVVAREAREQRKPESAHLAHLVAHGVLHASGYEHDSERGAQRMQRRESELLARFRLPDPWGSGYS